MVVRGRPQFVDPQLTKGSLRFAAVRGAQFSALQPANRVSLTNTAPLGSNRLDMASRPSWFQIGCLIRVGTTETVGELNLIHDLIDPTSLDTLYPLRQDHVVDDTADTIPQVSLIGSPGSFFGVAAAPLERRILLIESGYRLVPGDVLLASPSPEILDSLAEYPLGRANLIGTRPGIGIEPPVIYRYECEVDGGSGLLSFVPSTDLHLFVKAQPLFQRDDYASGDIKIAPNMGPCLLDAFYGGLLFNQKTQTVLGIKTYDIFGNQMNAVAAGNQQWERIPSNHLLMERPIVSETFLLWQRIQGQFQLLKTGNIFQAQLDENGEFVMTSDLLVPPWSSATQHGWVAPVLAEGDIKMSVQFEPQERQYYSIAHSTLTTLRPKIFADPSLKPITRIVVCIKGAPNSRVQLRTWSYDGSVVNSFSYYILGTGAVFGQDRWLAGGFSLKPVFYDLNVLKARYSDGTSRYNAGYIYS